MILLDTCAIVWDALARDKLSTTAASVIEQADRAQDILICDISIWEVAMLIRLKRVEVNTTASKLLNLLIDARSITVQEITPEIAEVSVNLSKEVNNDPADRLIAATSIIRGAPIVTADQNLRNAMSIETIW